MAIDDTCSAYVYLIAPDDTIVFVDQAWISFARENDAPELAPDLVLHRSLWEFIAAKETRHLYSIMVSRVRETGEPITIPFRCDAPDRRRFMEMGISLLSDGVVQFNTRVLRQEARDSILLLDPRANRVSELLTLCSWCKKALLPEQGWVEVEEAVASLSLFDGSLLPQLTHGVCPMCSEAIHQRLERSNAPA
jgi:hypothetical protein